MPVQEYGSPSRNGPVGKFVSSILGGTNTIFLQNTQDNGNGNFGTFEIRNYETDPNDSNSLINPCSIADVNFNPNNGQDQTITFEYTECCPE